jgi:hypothetical protein
MNVATSEQRHSEEVSFKGILIVVLNLYSCLRSRRFVVITAAVIGAVIGLVYAYTQKPVYTALSSIVLEEGASSGMRQFTGLASFAGINVGGNAGDIFQGDNIVELYRSRLMIERTLLSKVRINGKEQLLIDRFIFHNKLRKKWLEDDYINNISFGGNPERFNRKQDSLITDIVSTMNKRILNVIRLDNRLSVFMISVTSTDEAFAKLFNDKLVENVYKFYVETKTKKSKYNVEVLQNQADSIKRRLGYYVTAAASAVQATPNANPSLTTLRVNPEKKQIELQANTSIYQEIIKNLEVAKLALLQETPLIQVIDKPYLPLTYEKASKKKYTIVGFILGIVFSSLLILSLEGIKKVKRYIVENDLIRKASQLSR